MEKLHRDGSRMSHHCWFVSLYECKTSDEGDILVFKLFFSSSTVVCRAIRLQWNNYNRSTVFVQEQNHISSVIYLPTAGEFRIFPTGYETVFCNFYRKYFVSMPMEKFSRFFLAFLWQTVRVIVSLTTLYTSQSRVK